MLIIDTTAVSECVFCGDASCRQKVEGLRRFYLCQYCGLFSLPHYFAGTNFSEKYADKKHIIAGYLFEHNRNKVPKKIENALSLDGNSINGILSDARTPKTPIQRLERFLVNLYKLSEGQMYVTFELEKVRGTQRHTGKVLLAVRNGKIGFPVSSIAYAEDSSEASIMLKLLAEQGYMHVYGTLYYSFTFKGLERAEQLMSTNIDSKKVFVAMGFKEDLLEACEKAIKPACAACGFDAFLVKDNEHNNGITDQIMVDIKTSKFIIVDFTYNNAGAYFEAGFAQGLGLQVIRCCKAEWFNGKDEKGEKNQLHFDVRHYNTIIWKSHEELVDRLKANIRANIPGAIMRDDE